MKKTFFFVFLSFFFFNAAAQRNGIVSIARYNTAAPPMLDESDGLPEFEGGIEAFKKSFKSAFIFPKKTLETEQGGEGMIGFTVDTLGNIQDIEIIDSISPEIDAEALYVFSTLKSFKPMWKPMKLAVLYNAFPSIYKDELYNQQLNNLIKLKKPAEWTPFLNKKRPFALFAAHLGATTPTDALNRYLNPMFQLTGHLEIYKNRWGGGLSGAIRASKLRRSFEYDGNYWDKDTSITLNSFAFYAAYRLVEEERLTFTPFIGFSANHLAIPTDAEGETPIGIWSFLPTVGASVDLNWKQKAVNDWGSLRLNTTLIRLKFAVNMANFRDGRFGNLVDFGVGIGWFTREIVIKQ